MAREQGEPARLVRLLSIGAVAFLAAVAALAFSRVFAASEVPLRLIVVAVLSVALAALLERRNLLVATLVSGASLVVVVAILVFPDTTFAGIPTLHTFDSMLEAVKQVGHQARVEVAPTLTLKPLMLGAVTAVWTAAFSSHALAIRSGSPFLATLPPAALLTFAGMVLEDGPRPFYAITFLFAVLLLLFADGLQRVRQWGPLRPWSGSARSRRRLASSSTTRGARRVAVIALGVAVFVPGLLPGFRSEPILRIDSPSSGSVSINPLVSLAASLSRREAIPLFTVQTSGDRAAYWRFVALDRFDGQKWDTEDIAAEGGQEIEGAVTLPTYDTGVESVMLEQTFTVTGYEDVWLPAAFEPQSLRLGERSVRWDPQLTTLVDPDGLSDGTSYTVESALVAPNPRDLDIAIDYSASTYGRYIELPDDLPDQIRQVAEQLTAGEPTTFRKVLAIQDYLKVTGGFEYDESVRLGTEATAMVEFLTTARRGFCQQFALTMAVLLRTIGIPSRVAVGFTPGEFQPEDGLYHVSTRNAHAWVEVLFPGFGWLSFEPTPRRTNPVADVYQRLPSAALIPAYCAAQGCPRGVSEGGPGTSGGPSGETAGDTRRTNQETLDRTRSGTPVRPGIVLDPLPPPKRFPIALIVSGIVGLLILLLIMIPPVKWAWRRVQVRRARQPREMVLAAYKAFESRAADLGLGRRPAETLWEHRMRLLRRVEFSDGHLDRLTGITGRAAYSVRPLDEHLAGEAVDAGRIAIRDMRRATPLSRRLLGLYRLPRR